MSLQFLFHRISIVLSDRWKKNVTMTSLQKLSSLFSQIPKNNLIRISIIFILLLTADEIKIQTLTQV